MEQFDSSESLWGSVVTNYGNIWATDYYYCCCYRTVGQKQKFVILVLRAQKGVWYIKSSSKVHQFFIRLHYMIRLAFWMPPYLNIPCTSSEKQCTKIPTNLRKEVRHTRAQIPQFYYRYRNRTQRRWLRWMTQKARIPTTALLLCYTKITVTFHVTVTVIFV